MGPIASARGYVRRHKKEKEVRLNPPVYQNETRFAKIQFGFNCFYGVLLNICFSSDASDIGKLLGVWPSDVSVPDCEFQQMP